MRHPLHPLIVHFPIACWSLTSVGDLLEFWVDIDLSQMLFILLVIGCTTGLVAMLAGLYEITRIKNLSAINTKINHHMYAAIGTWCLYVISLLLRWQINVSDNQLLWTIISSELGFIGLIYTGWRGGNLVYRYGVGVSLATEG